MRLQVDSPPLFHLDRTLELPEHQLVRNILEGREVADVAVCVVNAPPFNQKLRIAVQIPNAGFAKTDFAMTETQVLEFSDHDAFLFSGSTSSRWHPILFVVATPWPMASQ